MMLIKIGFGLSMKSLKIKISILHLIVSNYSCAADADCAGTCGNNCSPTNCALTGRKRRAIFDGPIDGHYRPNNLMTPEDKARYIRSLKASEEQQNESLHRNERAIEVRR